jgi:RNA polymerase sigma-70 factor (ECF subfamily)
MEAPSDAELMRAVRGGCRESFGRLVDRWKDPLVNYLTRLTDSRERAQDLAQETFLWLFRSRARYDERGRLGALVYRIATNLLRSEERRAQRWRLLEPLLTAGAAPANGHGHWSPAHEEVLGRVLGKEAQRRVAEALAELPLAFRAPLVLYEVEGWSYAEIARWAGCREGTVKSRIHRGKQRLRERLEPYWNGGAG